MEALDVLAEALERPPEERAAFVREACGADDALRAEVESLMGHAPATDGFLETPAFALDDAELGELKPGETLGDCKILRLLGEGGMGEVYLAEDTRLERQVAIKLLKRQLDNETVLRHFRHERKVLAGLTHPNIARLYGGAMTADGRAYLVMEYVEGERLDQYCDAHGLDITARLQLFRKVCAAVTYAHQNLVVHRDLKPANIRVTPEGEPKLLDFGIAKLLEAETSRTADLTVTMFGALTPEYASPEQLRGEPITTATDVYSLGVILYELLTGQRPYAVNHRRPDELARAICEQEPPRPSAVARASQRRLAGDLDNIVAMALRKEPPRRYPSVAAFSNDLLRHIDGLPVVARKDTVGYRTGKFIRRNKMAAAAATLAVLALIGGILATTWQMRRAQRRFEDVRGLADSLIFEIYDSVQNLQGSTPTRQLIVTRALQYLDGLAKEGAGNRPLQLDLANAYEKIGDTQGNPYSANLGDKDGAEQSYLKATAIREALVQADPTVETRLALGRSYRDLGDIQSAKGNNAATLRRYRQSLAIFQSLARERPNDPAVLVEAATAYGTLGDGLAHDWDKQQAEVLRLNQQALAIHQRLLDRDPANPRYRRSLAIDSLKVGEALMPDKDRAEETIRRGIALLEALAKEKPDDARASRELGNGYHTLADTQMDAKDFAGALESRRRLLELSRATATGDPKNTQAQFDLGTAHCDLAEALTAAGNAPEALAEGQESLAIDKKLIASDPTNAIYGRAAAIACERLGAAASLAAQWPQAADWYEQARQQFTALRDRGALQPGDAGKPEELAAKVAASRAH